MGKHDKEYDSLCNLVIDYNILDIYSYRTTVEQFLYNGNYPKTE